MKVILLQDVKSLGKEGEVVNVSDGYGRNYIIPKNLGLEATIEQEKLEAAKDFAKSMEGKEVIVKMKAGEGGKTFGSISTKEIAKEAIEQLGMELDKKKIHLPEPIKSFGIFKVSVKLHPKVVGELSVRVEQR